MAFSNDFIWGVAGASYQVEGAWNEDGKGPSIWDTYTQQPQSPVRNHENGNIACDHYHHMKEDIALMAQLGIRAYRFSISWPRVIPNGTGEVNAKGLAFYSDLVDELLKYNIEPMVTLYHWDLPQALYDRGGWLNPEIIGWFSDYTKVIVDALSDRVKYWFTLNEPQIFIGLGYKLGMHAPFLRVSDRDLAAMTKNVLLTHGMAIRTIRAHAKTAPKISWAVTGPTYEPENDTPEAIEDARRRSFEFSPDAYILSNSWWGDPVFLGRFPEGAEEYLGPYFPTFTEEEWDIVRTPMDFYGCNIYNAIEVTPDPKTANEAKRGRPITPIPWPITPDVLYWSPKFLYERYKLPILITENGCANSDYLHLDGKVHDPQRIDFTKRYLRSYDHAASEGIPLVGYVYWSYMDNFEWGQGYDMRFGLIHIDYQTLKRTPKDSAYWYKEIIESNGKKIWE